MHIRADHQGIAGIKQILPSASTNTFYYNLQDQHQRLDWTLRLNQIRHSPILCWYNVFFQPRCWNFPLNDFQEQSRFSCVVYTKDIRPTLGCLVSPIAKIFSAKQLIFFLNCGGLSPTFRSQDKQWGLGVESSACPLSPLLSSHMQPASHGALRQIN